MIVSSWVQRLTGSRTEKSKHIHRPRCVLVNELGIPLQIPGPEAWQIGWLQPWRCASALRCDATWKSVLGLWDWEVYFAEHWTDVLWLVPTQRNFPLELNERETVKVKGQDKVRSGAMAEPGPGLRGHELLSPFTRENTQFASHDSSRQETSKHQTDTSGLPLYSFINSFAWTVTR